MARSKHQSMCQDLHLSKKINSNTVLIANEVFISCFVKNLDHVNTIHRKKIIRFKFY